MKRGKIDLKRIFIFLVIAIGLSNVFRFDLFHHQEKLEYLPKWLYFLVIVFLEGSGVLIGALVAIFLLKKERKTEISLLGTSPSKSFLMAIIPIIILTVMGVKNDYGLNPHLYGWYAATATLIYCIMEEYGWRGYLQEEMKDIEPWKKYTAIGFLWYLWHLTFLTGATIGDNLFFLGMMIFASWGIGGVAESTKSIIASACFHLLVQIMMFNALIRDGITGTEKIIIGVVSFVIWMVIIKRWEKQNGIVKL